MINLLFDEDNKQNAKILTDVIKRSYLASITADIIIELKCKKMKIINNDSNSPATIDLEYKKTHDEFAIFKKLFPMVNTNILDCTGGLCVDSLKLSKMGYNVTVIEENPIIVMLLRKLLEKEIINNFRVYHGNSFEFLRECNKRFEYIYIDTMFSKIKKKSKSKKEIEMLKILCREKISTYNLISQARKKALERVVSKAPIHSSAKIPIADFTISTKLIKYNIYNLMSTKCL